MTPFAVILAIDVFFQEAQIITQSSAKKSTL